MLVLRKLQKFGHDTGGSVSTIAALVGVALLTCVAASIELSTVQKKKTRLQDLADAAVLMAALSGETSQESLQEFARSSAKANYDGEFTLELTKHKDDLTVNIVENHETIMMGMVGLNDVKLSVTAGSQIGYGGKLRLVMALDTTQSMDGSRLSALQTAATDLITAVEDEDKGRNAAKVGIIPFADYVRIDKSYAGEVWLDVPPDRVSTWDAIDEDASTNCRNVIISERPTTKCDTYVYEERTSTVKWNGCMGSRPDGYHDTADFGTRRYKGVAGSGSCNGNYSIITPLTDDFKTLRDDINNFDANGQTYLPVGLVWGWRALAEEALFTKEVIDQTEETQRVLLLMTDGSNTTSVRGQITGWDGLYHWGVEANDEAQDKALADALSLQMCAAIKADNIRIITVAFEVSDEDTKSMLKACASRGSDYYDAIDSSFLKTAFGKIGAGLKEVRLTH